MDIPNKGREKNNSSLVTELALAVGLAVNFFGEGNRLIA
jgi:hypothetical protein